ncbi:hypothetical protein ILYODFUR_030504 [Ilyodon furcidens]|uniref:Uncharacterized protein n=1 Tax=Ilyodon furcidens TaxID=33524 RepID=A0ABV0UZA1_9TELE
MCIYGSHMFRTLAKKWVLKVTVHGKHNITVDCLFRVQSRTGLDKVWTHMAPRCGAQCKLIMLIFISDPARIHIMSRSGFANLDFIWSTQLSSILEACIEDLLPIKPD